MTFHFRNGLLQFHWPPANPDASSIVPMAKEANRLPERHLASALRSVRLNAPLGIVEGPS